MNKKLENKLIRFEDSQKKLLKELSKVDIQKLNRVTEKGKWSVAQVIYHLDKAESLSVSYVAKKMKDVDNIKNTGAEEWIKMRALITGLRSPFKFKAPVNVLGDIPENVDFSQISKQWNETREKLSTLVSTMPDELLVKNVFKQPVIGRINIYQMLDFMQAHFDRHKKQIERALL